jgi:hypothetical protein
MADSAFRGGLSNSLLEKDVTGSVDVTLTDAEARSRVQVYTGAIGAAIAVILPLAAGDAGVVFFVKNSATGAFALTVKGSIGSGVVVTATKKVQLVWNGADFEAWTAEL